MTTADDIESLVAALPRCATCGTPQLGGGACLYCRAVEAEGKIAALSFWGDDDWMRKIASIALDMERPRPALMPIGFELDLAACQNGPMNVMARPQMAFRPELLTVDPLCAHMGSLLDVKVGNRSMLVAFAALPLSLFSPSSWGSIEVMREVAGRFSWDTVNVAQDITLTVDMSLASYDPLVQVARDAVNLPTPTKFRAVVWGRVDDPFREQHTRQPVSVTTDDVRSVRDTMEFHDLVRKMRTPGRRSR